MFLFTQYVGVFHNKISVICLDKRVSQRTPLDPKIKESGLTATCCYTCALAGKEYQGYIFDRCLAGELLR